MATSQEGFITGQYKEITMDTLNILRLTETAIIPTRATNGSAGYDLYADIKDSITIMPNKCEKISTGICIEISEYSIVGLVYPRSGLATKFGIILSNCVGVIDSDYRGEIIVSLWNTSDIPYTIRKGDRMAQLVLTPILTPELNEVSKLSQTVRGDGGFGSTNL